MELNSNTSDSHDKVVDEAVAHYENGESAAAIAHIVQETDSAERQDVLDAVANEVDPDELGRLERREL